MKWQNAYYAALASTHRSARFFQLGARKMATDSFSFDRNDLFPDNKPQAHLGLRGFGADDVIMLGYNMCLSTTAETEEERANALLVVREFKHELGNYDHGTPEHRYLVRFFGIANKLAIGIKSRRRKRERDVSAAYVDMMDKSKERVFYTSLTSVLKTGGRILVLGFFIGAAVVTTMSHPVVAGKAKTDPVYTSLLFASGSMLMAIGMAWYQSWRNSTLIWNEYKASVNNADQEYVLSAYQEYRQSAEQAEYEWRDFFPGIAPRTSPTVNNLIRGLSGMDMYIRSDQSAEGITFRDVQNAFIGEIKRVLPTVKELGKKKFQKWVHGHNISKEMKSTLGSSDKTDKSV